MANSRKCGACAACCTTMGVPELKKAQDVPCEFIGKGCQKYESRPSSCRQFACLWLQGLVEGEFRPDRCGLVLDVTEPRNGMQAVVAHEVTPNAAYVGEGARLVQKLALKVVVIVRERTGNRRMFGPPGAVQEVLRASLLKGKEA